MFEIKELRDIQRYVNGLQNFTAHVQNIQSAIGRVHEVYRATPVVRRADKFGFLISAL